MNTYMKRKREKEGENDDDSYEIFSEIKCYIHQTTLYLNFKRLVLNTIRLQFTIKKN